MSDWKKDLDLLLAKVVEDELSATEMVRLDEILFANPDAREFSQNLPWQDTMVDQRLRKGKFVDIEFCHAMAHLSFLQVLAISTQN